MNLATLQQLALDVASARSLDSVLLNLSEGVAAEPGIAMARVWLMGPGDLCDACPLREECPDRSRCLHLVASAGRSVADPDQTWNSTDGRFSRFPLGVRKVGRIGGSGKAELLRIDDDSEWIADAVWARAEQLHCFAGQPLVFRGEVLGVLAVFSREAIDEECLAWLRTFADQAAVAIANARAFEEVQQLREQLELERDYLREEVKVARSHSGIVGESPAIQRTLSQIEKVARSDANVLIIGESGTGKELIASALHEQSDRREKPMVRVNCASIPHDLFESEFFGHVRGAFTGATGDRKGRFQVADGGTLLLDEVGEIPLELQGKLLRVLQEGAFSPVGSDRTHSVDVRILAATNRDLQKSVEAGEFRQDLYYRLAVFPIDVPPLRERKTDIPLLAGHFLRLISSRRNASGLILRQRDVAALTAYDWPGNIRELQNVIERAAILSTADRLHIDLAAPGEGGNTPASPGTSPSQAGAEDGEGLRVESERLADMKADIERALGLTDGRVSGPSGAAALLGIKPTTLASRMKALGIPRPQRSGG